MDGFSGYSEETGPQFISHTSNLPGHIPSKGSPAVKIFWIGDTSGEYSILPQTCFLAQPPELSPNQVSAQRLFVTSLSLQRSVAQWPSKVIPFKIPWLSLLLALLRRQLGPSGPLKVTLNPDHFPLPIRCAHITLQFSPLVKLALHRRVHHPRNSAPAQVAPHRAAPQACPHHLSCHG